MSNNFPDLTLNDGSSRLDPNKNDYFLVTITDLLPGKTYPIEFRWNYSDNSKKGVWGAVVKVTTSAYAPNAVTSVTPSWEGTTFNLTFTSNKTDVGNENLSYYRITLVASDLTTRTFRLEPVSGSTQKFSFSRAQNLASFIIVQSAFSGNIVAVDKDGNESTAVSFPLTSRTNRLPAPVITVDSITAGYTVSYTTPSSTTYPEYDHIEIEEVESNSSTDPGTGYSVIFSGVANPAIINRSNTNKRWVRAKFWDNGVTGSVYSNAVAVTPTAAVTVDSTAPSAPASGSVTAGIDNSTGATIGFNAYIDISWSAVSDATLKGYRIRFRENGTSNPYSYVDSPGTGTTFRLTGLSIGTTYEVGIASYDEFNNTTGSYTSLGTAVASGTPFIGKNVTTVGYFGASATGDTGTFKFGYGVQDSGGTKRGLVFNSNNYWYIDSSQSALFKLGGDTNNFISWDGGTFIVQGDIRARAGVFTGNVQVSTGSLYAGSSPSSGARLAISSSGLSAYDSGGTATTNIYSNITSGGVTFTTTAATIGNWSVTSNAISKTQGNGTITLDSSNARITVSAPNSGYTAGLYSPVNNSASDIVIFAGNSTPSSAPFRVRADGGVTMTNATITGYATSGDISNFITAGQVNSNVTSISGGVISTGTINLNNVNVNTGTGNNSIRLSSTGLELYNNVGTRTVYLNPSNGSAEFTGTITGSTITGGTIQTSTSGNRIEINNGSYLNQMAFYTSATVPGTIYAYTSGSQNILSISSPYSTGNQGNISVYSLAPNSYITLSADQTSASGTMTASTFYTGAFDSSSVAYAPGTYISTSGAIISRRDDFIPMFAHRFSTASPYTGATNREMWRGILEGTSRGSIYISMTGSPSLTVPSDYRLKENIRDYNGSIDIIKSKRLRVFNLKNDPTKTDTVGFIAHEFGEDNSELVIGSKDAVDKDGNPEYQSVAFTNLIPYLTGALKEIILKVESLEQRLDALEG
jgi:hypothetical protein